MRFMRMVLRIIVITLYQSHKDLVMLRASALTYTVILSIVPLLALGTAVLKGLGAGDQMRNAAYTFIVNFEAGIVGENFARPGAEPGNSTALELRSEDEGRSADKGASELGLSGRMDAPPPSMLLHMRNAVDRIFDYVDKTNFATIGIFGVVGLLVIVLALLDSIEEAINAIWKPARRRPFGRKFMDYLALLILFPIAVNVGFAAMAAVQSEKFLAAAMQWFPFPFLGALVFNVLPCAVVITTFMLLYRFLPNTKVEFSSALAGGVVGGVGWLLVQVLYIKLQLGVARYNAIYGSFATLPLVLVWIYMGWLVFLAGAEVSFATQVWRRFRIGDNVMKPASELASACDTVAAVFDSFKHGKAVSMRQLSDATGLMETDLARVVAVLERGGVIRQVRGEGGDDNCFMPSGPADTVTPGRVFETVLGAADGKSWGAAVVNRSLPRAVEAASLERWPAGDTVHHGEKDAGNPGDRGSAGQLFAVSD